MASKDQSYTGGYECIFVEEPPDDLKCSICLCVARDPQQHGGGCGKIFCRGCVTKHQEKSEDCPNCRGRITTFKDNKTDTNCAGERDILSLKVKCDNEGDGCQWMGELRSLDQHLQTCGYVKLPCPNECLIFDMKDYVKLVFRKDLDNHLQEECPRRQHTCPQCEETGEYEFIIDNHRNTCPKMEISCPNEECKAIFPRDEQQAHLSVCPYQKVVCKYQEYGCQVELLRKDLAAHEGDDKTHLRMTMDTLLVTRRELKEQCDKVTQLQKKHTELSNQILGFLLSQSCPVKVTAPFVFKLPNFTEKKENNIGYYSPPFLTHPQGYKTTICVDANGYDDHKGTHISVCAYLMRGEYDDQLDFPFKGTITFELQNQLEDRSHLKKWFTYNGKEKGGERVTDGERANIAPSLFIPHSQLGYDAAKNCQYLKDDCLVFRIYAEVSSYKPWLQCTSID